METAGGVRSPLAGDDGDAVALAGSLMPDVVVLVADAGLGTINAVRLTVAALDPVLETREDTAAGGGAQPLRPRRRPAPSQPGLAGRPRRHGRGRPPSTTWWPGSLD